MHGFKRLVGALLALDMRDVERFKIALEHAHIRARGGHRVGHVGGDLAGHALGGGDRLLARLAHLQGELLDAALDRAQVAGLVIRRIELVRDVQDLPFHMLECGLIARRGVGMVELVGERLDQRLDILRQRSDLLHPRVERLRQFGDAVGERVEPGGTCAFGDVVDAGTQRLHVSGQRRDTLGRGDAGGKLAQLHDRRLQIAQRLGIGGAGRDAVHLAGQFGDARVEARQAFGRRHGVEPLMHLGKAALDCLEL